MLIVFNCASCLFIIRPLSMSENLSRLAQRIDFVGKDDEVGGRNNSGVAASAAGEPMDESSTSGGGTTQGNSEEQTFKTAPAWPWESARNKLQ